MPRVFRLLYRPDATWRELRASDPAWHRVVLNCAVPLAVLPSVAWPLGRAMAGAKESLLAGFGVTMLLSLACLLLLALGFYLLAPFFDVQRHWSRSVALACYSATPVFLCGALLFVPVLVVASVGGLFYGIGLCAQGLPVMLGARGRDVSAYIAMAAVFEGLTSTALGALCSAIGLI